MTGGNRPIVLRIPTDSGSALRVGGLARALHLRGGMLIRPSTLAQSVIAAAIEVHRNLGPGLLESAYARCLAYELAVQKIPFKREVMVPIMYKGLALDQGFRADFVINDELLVEVKSTTMMGEICRAQVVTYLRLMKLPHGLLINFNRRLLTDGVRSVLP